MMPCLRMRCFCGGLGFRVKGLGFKGRVLSSKLVVSGILRTAADSKVKARSTECFLASH